MPSEAPKFVAEEVWKVARALIDGAEYVDDSGRSAHQLCNHCQGSEWYSFSGTNRPLTHDSDCPVLVARDLLTGAPDA